MSFLRDELNRNLDARCRGCGVEVKLRRKELCGMCGELGHAQIGNVIR